MGSWWSSVGPASGRRRCSRRPADGQLAAGTRSCWHAGSELEAEFAFGVIRQLFERRLMRADVDEHEALLAGHARAVRPLLMGEPVERSASDKSFAVLHGLYWLAANLADRRSLLIAVDDAHWADEASLRWLAYLAPGWRAWRWRCSSQSCRVSRRQLEPRLRRCARRRRRWPARRC